jgi:alanyl-tRNA synthetase
VNQAGAKKTLKNSHLDLTHYEQIPRNKLLEIENKANQIVEEGIDLNLSFIPRTEAEQKYGMTIYQGGAVPGKNLRIVEIPGIDVEACGGTHLNNTSETGYIHIIKSQKIQDGIVRLTFVAGEATNNLRQKHKRILEEIKGILNVDRKQLMSRIKELFEKWKNINKSLKSGIIDETDLKLTSSEIFEGDVLSEISQFLNTKKEGIPAKIQKLYQEWTEGVKKIKKLKNLLSDDYIKDLVKKAQKFEDYKLILDVFDNLPQNDLKNFSVRLMKHSEDLITIFLNKTEKGIMILGMMGSKPAQESEFNVGDFIKESVTHFNGKGGGKKDYGQGVIDNFSIDDVKAYILNKLKIASF